MPRSKKLNIHKVVGFGVNKEQYYELRELAFKKESSISDILRGIVYPNKSKKLIQNKKIKRKNNEEVEDS